MHVRMEDVFEVPDAAVGIALLDDEGVVCAASSALCTMMGHEPGSLVGNRVFISTGGWTQSEEHGTTCETSSGNVLVGQAGAPAKPLAEVDPKNMRILIVHDYVELCQPYGLRSVEERKALAPMEREAASSHTLHSIQLQAGMLGSISHVGAYTLRENRPLRPAEHPQT
mmetsp:Transcript_41188/g.100497  ORF Transcript_41188/g.100497 Transcript_41188/m.100497 type:complete len:169 (-) Transcript_41188:641-1147(-)